MVSQAKQVFFFFLAVINLYVKFETQQKLSQIKLFDALIHGYRMRKKCVYLLNKYVSVPTQCKELFSLECFLLPCVTWTSYKPEIGAISFCLLLFLVGLFGLFTGKQVLGFTVMVHVENTENFFFNGKCLQQVKPAMDSMFCKGFQKKYYRKKFFINFFRHESIGQW